MVLWGKNNSLTSSPISIWLQQATGFINSTSSLLWRSFPSSTTKLCISSDPMVSTEEPHQRFLLQQKHVKTTERLDMGSEEEGKPSFHWHLPRPHHLPDFPPHLIISPYQRSSHYPSSSLALIYSPYLASTSDTLP